MHSNTPPTVSGHWLWGNLRQFNADSLRFLEKATQIDDVVAIRFGPLTGYCINHPDLVRTILTSPEQFQKPPLVQRALYDITGRNIFTSNGDYWKYSRKLMQPAFHARTIANYVDTIIEYTQQELATWHDGDVISFDDAMTNITMRVIIKTMFGTELSQETAQLGTLFSSLFQLVYGRMERYGLVPTWLPTQRNQRIKHYTSQLRQMIENIIAKRRASNEHHEDLLALLLDAQANSGGMLDDDDIIREALTIFGAGYETTAYAIIFASYALAQHPELQTDFAYEIASVVGNRPISYDDLALLPSSENIIKEALRLYPTAWGFSRWTTEATTLGHYHLPANRTLLISPWTLGRDARWWDVPLEFKPSRFDSGDYPRYAYIPFGGGARICIGNQLAMLEARLILTMMVQQFCLSLADDTTMRPINAAFTLRPENGLSLRVTSRQFVPSGAIEKSQNPLH
ncbi:MAG: cytochrome P450 [Chloroflexota bacterium]